MTPDPDDTTPSEAILMRFNKELEGIANVEEADRIYTRYLASYPDLARRLTASLNAKLRTFQEVERPIPAQTCLLEAGDRLGAFTVKNYITRGGMGEIYEATQDDVNRRVALKVSSRPLGELGTLDRLAADQFAREFRVPANLHQTNVVPIHYAGCDAVRGQKIWFYVMHFVDGVNLTKLLEQLFNLETTQQNVHETPPLGVVVRQVATADTTTRRVLESAAYKPQKVTLTAGGSLEYTPTAETLEASKSTVSRAATRTSLHLPKPTGYYVSVARTLEEIGEAVGYLHASGYRHRDIKPANIMLSKDNHSYLIDFGLADKANGERPASQSWTDGYRYRLLESGTVEYMAPEQFTASGLTPDPIGPAADVYSLGVTLYELLTLRPAFRAPDPIRRIEVIESIVTGTYTPPSELVTNVPPGLAMICAKAMAKNPADRYETATQFADDLKRWRTWQPTVAHPGRGTLRPLRLWAWRHKGLAFALACAVLLLLGSAAWAVDKAEQRRKELLFTKAHADVVSASLAAEKFIGWPETLRNQVRELQKLRPDADLKDYWAASLVGLDAKPVVKFDIPAKPGTVVGYSSVAFSPSGQRMATGGWMQPTIDKPQLSPGAVWDDNRAHPPSESKQPGAGPVTFVDETTAVQLIEPTADRNSLLLWNLTTNQKVAEMPVDLANVQDVTVALSPDAKFAAASTVDLKKQGKTILWSIAGANVKPIREFAFAATALTFSAEAKHLAGGTNDGDVAIFSTATGQEELRLSGGSLPVQSLAFGRNFFKSGRDKPRSVAGGIPGLFLAVGSSSGLVTILDLETRSIANIFRGASHYVNAMAFSPDGSMLALAGHEAPLLLDVASGRVLFHFYSQQPGRSNMRRLFSGVQFSTDGRRIAFSSYAGHGGEVGLDVLELDEDRGVRTYRGLSGWVEKTWLSPNRKYVAALSHQWQLGVWERTTGRLLGVWDVPIGWTADNAAATFDAREESIVFSAGDRISQYSLGDGSRTNSWVVPKGLNDELWTKPDGTIWSLRRDIVPPNPPDAKTERHFFVLRELQAKGQSRSVYQKAPPPGNIHQTLLTPNGKYLTVYIHTNPVHPSMVVYDAMKFEPQPLPATNPPDWITGGFITDDGNFLSLTRHRRGTTEPQVTQIYRYPGLTLHETPGDPARRMQVMDNTAKLTADAGNRPDGKEGVALFRVRDAEMLVTLDIGHKTSIGVYQYLTGDGKFCSWGRTDGTVLVADVNQCLEALTAK